MGAGMFECRRKTRNRVEHFQVDFAAFWAMTHHCWWNKDYTTTILRSNNNPSSGGPHVPTVEETQDQKNEQEKVVDTMSWDKESILMTDCFPNGQTAHAKYNSNLLRHLKNELKEKRGQGRRATVSFFFSWTLRLLARRWIFWRV